ncbi:free fatty acid receptor 3-like [Notolabrus celidotus]|uniref:free fatty acid receptor 3-like n=1 Tax=Notolabrus celidotus TaxID=1203425 RepID=UPI00148F6E03|nr:free fatty acid receptor 3-like [Notolabrus celidotus]
MSKISQMTQVHENYSLLCEDPVYYSNVIGITVDWVLFLVGLPEVCLACYALLCLLKKDKVAPVFVLNLLLSDLLQIGITGVFIVSRFYDPTYYPFLRARCISRLFIRLGLTSSLSFMQLISAERFVMVACPLWYRTKNSLTLSILISVCIWILSLVYSSLDYYLLSHTRYPLLLFAIVCLFPAPFLLGLYIATWKALHKSAAMRHGTKNRRRVLGVLSLMLGTYIVSFFPFIIRNLYYSLKADDDSDKEDLVKDLSGVLTSALVYLSPLVDSVLYIFIRSDIGDTLEAFSCCRTALMKLKGFKDSPWSETTS